MSIVADGGDRSCVHRLCSAHGEHGSGGRRREPGNDGRSTVMKCSWSCAVLAGEIVAVADDMIHLCIFLAMLFSAVYLLASHASLLQLTGLHLSLTVSAYCLWFCRQQGHLVAVPSRFPPSRWLWFSAYRDEHTTILRELVIKVRSLLSACTLPTCQRIQNFSCILLCRSFHDINLSFWLVTGVPSSRLHLQISQGHKLCLCLCPCHVHIQR